MSLTHLIALTTGRRGPDTSGWAAEFLSALLRAVAWHTVSGLFHTFGLLAVAVGVVIAVVAWRRNRKGGKR